MFYSLFPQKTAAEAHYTVNHLCPCEKVTVNESGNGLLCKKASSGTWDACKAAGPPGDAIFGFRRTHGAPLAAA